MEGFLCTTLIPLIVDEIDRDRRGCEINKDVHGAVLSLVLMEQYKGKKEKLQVR